MVSIFVVICQTDLSTHSSVLQGQHLGISGYQWHLKIPACYVANKDGVDPQADHVRHALL